MHRSQMPARETGAPALHRITPLTLRAAVRPGHALSMRRCVQDKHHRPCSLSRPGAGLSFFPLQYRGDGAPMKRVRGNKRIISFGDDAAPLGAPSRRLTMQRAALSATTQRWRGPLSASSWREVLVPPGGVRHRPGAWEERSSPARGRRILLRFMTPHEAPSVEQDGEDYSHSCA